ncbi:MAG: hypothetical protein LBU67_02655 [Oscillospiraceae bacterium]|jgi:hypothetical protein|nr:hypothetical protein [Oscillospiraceae bacterium]
MGLATVISSGVIRLTWSAVPGAQWYRVQREKLGLPGQWEDIGIPTGTVFDAPCHFGAVTKYQVIACARQGLVEYYSAPSGWRTSFGLSTPGIKSIESVDVTGVKFTWTGVANADGYYLSYSEQPNASHTPANRFKDVTPGSATTVTQYSMFSTGKTYYFRIQAYNTSQNPGVTYVGPLSMAIPFTRTVPKAALISVDALTDTQVRLNWNEVLGAGGYNIYRSTSASTVPGARIATISGGSTLTATAAMVKGSINYYRVCGYSYYNGKMLEGPLSNVISIFPLTAPTLTDVHYSSGSSVFLSWKLVDGATDYEVERKRHSADTVPTTILTPGGHKMTWGWLEDTTPNIAGESHWYRVRAVWEEGSSSSKGPWSSWQKAKVAAPTLTSVVGQRTGITLTWKANAGGTAIDAFRIERSLDPNSGWAELSPAPAITSSGSGVYTCTDDPPLTSTTYYYRVRAVHFDNSSSSLSAACVDSDPSNIAGGMKVVFDAPSLDYCRPYQTSGVNLSWSSVSGNPDGFAVERRAENGVFTHVAYIENGTSMYDSDLAPGVYEYRVRAYRIVGGMKQYGAYSNVGQVAILAAPVVTGHYVYMNQTQARMGWTITDPAKKVAGYILYSSNGTSTDYDTGTNLGLNAGRPATNGWSRAYTVNGLAANKTYYFRVAAFQAIDGLNYVGKLSEPFQVTTSARASLAPLQSNAATTTYPPNMAGTAWSYSIPGAYRLVLTFSADTKFERDFDYIEIYTRSGALVGRYTGTALAGATVGVLGDSFTIRMWSDRDVQYRGFKVNDVTAYVGATDD